MADFSLTDEYGFLGGVGGTCALCNASKRSTDRPERIVTTNLVTDMVDAPPGVWPEKYMEFCETCITELGHLVGMASEQEVQQLHRDIENADATVEQLTEQVFDLQLRLDTAVKALELFGTPEAVK